MSDARAVVLLSGGLDSATALAIAAAQGFACYALSVDYGQRHVAELEAARRVAAALGRVEHRIMQRGSGRHRRLGAHRPRASRCPRHPTAGIPVTYVPARNTMMLALALGWAEVLQARDIFIGVNVLDSSGYPDCRPEFIAAFEALAALATRAGVEGAPARVHAPLIRWTKAQIIRAGTCVWALTTRRPCPATRPTREGRACGRCDSCRLRRAGFAQAGVADPTRYRSAG